MIPKKIYQSWKTKNLPKNLEQNVAKLKALNPEYEHVLFDDEDCKKFLLDNFGQSYVDAFDILIPGAFKCDFWRYAMMYVNGGVYLDLDIDPVKPLRELVSEDDEFVSVVDRTVSDLVGIYQAFLACRPKHPVMKLSLEFSFSNIATRRTGLADMFSITGPNVVANALNVYWGRKNTNAKIRPGKYPGGVVLYRNTGKKIVDDNGTVLFNNTVEGYSNASYMWNESYYKDDPRKAYKRRFFLVILIILILAILGVILSVVFRKKWKNCQSSCSQSSNSSSDS